MSRAKYQFHAPLFSELFPFDFFFVLAITFQLLQIFHSNFVCIFILRWRSVNTKPIFHHPLFLELLLPFIHFTCHNHKTVNTWPEVTIFGTRYFFITFNCHIISGHCETSKSNTFCLDCVAMVMDLGSQAGWNYNFVWFSKKLISIGFMGLQTRGKLYE